MIPWRDHDIKFVKGIGPARAQLLASEANIHSVYDLLHYFPNHYYDRSKVYRIADLDGTEAAAVQLRGRFVSFNVQGEGVKARLTGLFTDGTRSIEIVWFQSIRRIRESLQTATEYLVFGRPGIFNGQLQMVHPEVDTLNSVQTIPGMRGVYPLTERLRNRGITSRQFFQWTQAYLSSVKFFPDPLPRQIIDGFGLMSLDQAIRAIHCPSDNAQLKAAQLRMKFEELFYIQVDMLRRNRRRKSATEGHVLSRIGSFFNNFYSTCLPFPLTGAQKRVIKEIRADVVTGRQMNRLVQGDVGSGKTLVALMSMLIALDNGLQACLMAPTEILATQHYQTLKKMVAPIGVRVELLTGSTRKKKRDEIHAGLVDGSVHILVGTHAVLEDNVEFSKLGFVVIDEQHRFGVAQRARLWQKSAIPPHVLVMTATPIPRTLAMTVYGDLDVSVIDELPPGRKPVTTLLRYDDRRQEVYRSIGRELAAGRQVYVVYPLIDENSKLDLRSVMAGYETISETFPTYRTALVHGRMKPAEKEHQMQLFVSGEARILVATTVIEVGVNVPNASVMLIENAERFGLSQLHQLRGRVGRGADKSYCVLMSKLKIAKETRKRLEIMTATTDGFLIAEADMQMRGPGDIEGTMQSGIPFDLRIANLATDGQIISMARKAAEVLLDSDPELTSRANAKFAAELAANVRHNIDWSRIS